MLGAGTVREDSGAGLNGVLHESAQSLTECLLDCRLETLAAVDDHQQTQSNGKIERWHKTIKSDALRPASPRASKRLAA